MNENTNPGILTHLKIDTRVVLSVSTNPVLPAGGDQFELLRLPDMAVRVVQKSTAQVLWYYLRVEKKSNLDSLDLAAVIDLLVEQFDNYLKNASQIRVSNQWDLVRDSAELENFRSNGKGDARLAKDLGSLLRPASNPRAELTGLAVRDIGTYGAEDVLADVANNKVDSYRITLDLPRQCRLTITERTNMQRRGQNNEVSGTVMLFGEKRQFTLGSTVFGMPQLSELLSFNLNETKVLREIEFFVMQAWPFMEGPKFAYGARWD